MDTPTTPTKNLKFFLSVFPEMPETLRRVHDYVVHHGHGDLEADMRTDLYEIIELAKHLQPVIEKCRN